MWNTNIQPNLEIIKTALQENRILLFKYTNHTGNITSRIVEPYQLVLKSSHWYLQAYCHIRNDFRLFKVSRISDLQIQKELFIPRNYPKPQLDITDIVEEIQTEIKIRIHRSIMDRVLDYCNFENFVPDGDDHYIVCFPFIEREYYYDILLSFGDKCECLEPPHIRMKMKRRIQGIAELYKK